MHLQEAVKTSHTHAHTRKSQTEVERSLSLTIHYLGELAKVTSSLWASVFSSVKWHYSQSLPVVRLLSESNAIEHWWQLIFIYPLVTASSHSKWFTYINSFKHRHYLMMWWLSLVKVSVAQLCPALHDPMDCSLPGSSMEFFVHGILQAKILEWVVMPSSRGSSQPRDQTWLSYISYIGRQALGILLAIDITVSILQMRKMGLEKLNDLW